jgi:hypothetical protein
MADEDLEEHEQEESEFRELLKYTIPGYFVSLVSAVVLDRFGLQHSGIGQWFVRTMAGEGESIFEGVYSLRHRFRHTTRAEAYGFGKMAGLAVPWVIDLISRWAGLNIHGVEGFYIPYFYAMSDQIGANVSGLVYHKRQENTWSRTFISYSKDPVMMSSLLVVLLVPFGLLALRLAGFSPSNQVLTALETIGANLCWVPPLIGWFADHRKNEARRED